MGDGGLCRNISVCLYDHIMTAHLLIPTSSHCYLSIPLSIFLIVLRNLWNEVIFSLNYKLPLRNVRHEF